MEHNELKHHGVLGMKWGRRRYQNKDGSLTPAGKKRRAKGDEKEETPEQKKERILKSPKAKDVYENKDLFTNKEINDLKLRFENLNNIEKMIPEKKSKGKKFVESYISTGKTISDVVNTTDNLYKSYQKGKALIAALSKSK